MTDNDKHFCGSRGQNPAIPGLPKEDHWRTEPDGSRTCSYCGSLHADDMFQILEEYVKGTEGYRFSSTTKSYKLYANRPNVRNAGDGGIKFYGWHLDPNDPKKAEHEELLNKAYAKLALDMQQKYGS